MHIADPNRSASAIRGLPPSRSSSLPHPVMHVCIMTEYGLSVLQVEKLKMAILFAFIMRKLLFQNKTIINYLKKILALVFVRGVYHGD